METILDYGAQCPVEGTTWQDAWKGRFVVVEDDKVVWVRTREVERFADIPAYRFPVHKLPVTVETAERANWVIRAWRRLR